ncbi:BTAD domain-containing putative transcriptional regulator [Dactylosporangium sp. CA-092794]|uniref:BTAD domain-containing putative transcriptional regulator n=1 Tax=Dactylosporangium sp. CA-092794 TaxID=3239929 RepID=UPI003D8ECBA6
MLFRLLPGMLVGDDERPVELPPIRLSVLALLLVHANQKVSTDQLRGEAWDGADVSGTQIHKAIADLRVFLDGLGRRDALVTVSRFGYRLNLTADDLDLLAFQQASAAAAEARNRDDGDAEIEALRRALSYFRDVLPLQGIPGRSMPSYGRELQQRRKRAAIRLCELLVPRRRHAELLEELTTLFRFHATDRSVCEFLMRAQHYGGHSGDALDTYTAHAEALEAELGTAPAPELRTLMYDIASGKDVDGAYDPQAEVPSRVVAVPRQLPMDEPDLIGRADHIRTAVGQLTGERRTPAVIVLTGLAGIGKTALAVHIAHLVRDEYPDGQVFVELRGTEAEPARPGEVMAQILRAFGSAQLPETLEERRSSLRTLLGSRRVLLVFDDASAEAQLRDLMPGDAGSAVLITARNRLPGLPGALHLPALEPLSLRESIELFERIVTRSGESVAAEPEATHRIAELCDGLPLAITIAAAVRGEPGRTCARLVDRLTDQPLGALVHQERSVAYSIGASVERLDPAAQRLFFVLGMLQLVDFAPWVAAAALDLPLPEASDALLRLARCSLLQVSTTGRYRLHTLTRAYSRSLAGDAGADVERVYTALLTLVRRAHRSIYRGDYEVVHGTVADWDAPEELIEDVRRAPLEWCEAERANIRAGVRHATELGLVEHGWDLAVSTHEFYNLRHHLDDWRETHLVALHACRRAGDERGEAAVLTILGQPALVADGRQRGVSGSADLERALRIFRRLEDRHGEAIALRTLANSLRRAGRLDEALTAFGQALTLYRGCDDVVGQWQALRYIGQTQLDLGQHGSALASLTAAAEVAAGSGSARLRAQSAYWLGWAYLGGDDLAAAQSQFQQVLQHVTDADEIGQAYAHHGLGEVARRGGDEAAAMHWLASAIALAERGGDAVLEGRAHLALARLHLAAGRVEAERNERERAVVCFTAVDADYLRREANTGTAA